MRKSGHGCYHRGLICVPPVMPAAHPSFPRSLSPTQIGEREYIPPLIRLSREACPRPRPGSGNTSRRSPVFPAKFVPGPDRGAGTHPAAHPSFPRKLAPGPDRGAGTHPAAHPSFPRKLAPGPDRGAGVHPAAHPSCPPLTGHSRRSPVIPAKLVPGPDRGAGIHAFLMLDCHWTSPKCIGKQELSRKLNDPGRYHARVPAPKCRRCRGRFSTEGCCKGYPLQHQPKVQPEAATRVALCTVAAAWHWS